MSSRANGSKSGEELLAKIMDDILSTSRDDRGAAIAEYTRRYPQLQSQIEQQLEAVQALESAALRLKAPSGAQSIGAHLDCLPSLLQKVIVLRSFRKLDWNEISAELCFPEADLQQIHAKAMCELVERFGRKSNNVREE